MDFVRQEMLPDWRAMWAYSRWLLASRALGQGSRVLMPWLVAWYLGVDGAGVLAACVTLVGLSWIFVRGVNNYFRPVAVWAFQQDGAQALRLAVMRPTLFFTMFLGGLCLVYAFAGDWLYLQVFGEQRPGVWVILSLQGLVTLAISLVAVATNGLAAIDRPRSTLWIEGASMIATIVCALALIPNYALVGASLAMLLGSTASAAVAFWLLRRELEELGRLPPRSTPQRRNVDLGAFTHPQRLV
jgi:O-antigen/teichoic acid export membrane protein